MSDEGTEADTATGPQRKRRRRIDAAAEQHKRLESAELNKVLAAKRCPACNTAGCWEIYNRERDAGRVRYVRCKACGHYDQAPVVVAARGNAQ
jgi:DNA-directed RNA polymerase subunit M/transcription elongation factor TFIIS